MTRTELFIRDPKAFHEARNRIAVATRPERSLPAQVFGTQFTSFRFDEFDHVLSGAFWPALQRLAAASGDSSLILAVLDPEPEGYFYREFGDFGWAHVPTALSADEYWAFLNLGPAKSPADAVLMNSETVVWLPMSMRWAIWGERSLGLAILAELAPSAIGEWRDIEFALDTCLPLNFRDHTVPIDFEHELRRHYQV